jgi:hypothetical protein
MNPKYLGDSYDIVKQSLLSWLGAVGTWSTHPMFTEPVSREQGDTFSRLLGTPLLSNDTLTQVTDRATYLAPAFHSSDHVFLDPDTGIRLKPIRGKKAPRYLFGTELLSIANARPEKLTLVFDQALGRGEERIQLQTKLNDFAQQGVLGIAYVSHACFVLVARNRNLVQEAFEMLKKESRLPENRFLSWNSQNQAVHRITGKTHTQLPLRSAEGKTMEEKPTLTEGRSSVQVIQDEIRDHFAKLKYPILSIKFDILKLRKFAIRHCQRLKLNPEEGLRRICDVWWAIASAQLSLGYMIVAKNSAGSPRGSEQRVIAVKELQFDFNISDLHFWHHANLSIECLYRIWERLANLLKFFSCLPAEKKLYFDGVVAAIKAKNALSDLTALKDVSANVKHWNIIAGKRNTLSHEGSRLFGDDSVTDKEYSILKADGNPLEMMTTKSPDLVQVIEEIKERFVRCGKAFTAAMSFIEEMPSN